MGGSGDLGDTDESKIVIKMRHLRGEDRHLVAEMRREVVGVLRRLQERIRDRQLARRAHRPHHSRH